LEELADILEVVDGLALHLGSSFEEILELKRQKREARGGFVQGILLEWVED
jgi:predicted house-cleaning noncanonical NTP pyrophosphatase (MazG superfamily)